MPIYADDAETMDDYEIQDWIDFGSDDSSDCDESDGGDTNGEGDETSD